jgi:hypothetical protein
LHAIELLDGHAARLTRPCPIGAIVRGRSIARRHAAAIDPVDEVSTEPYGIGIGCLEVRSADVVARVTVSRVAGPAPLGKNRLNVGGKADDP